MQYTYTFQRSTVWILLLGLTVALQLSQPSVALAEPQRFVHPDQATSYVDRRVRPAHRKNGAEAAPYGNSCFVSISHRISAIPESLPAV